MADKYTRAAFARNIWRQSVINKWLGLVWTAYGFAAASRDELLPEDLQSKYRMADMLGILLSIPLAWWLVGALVIALAWLFEASYRDASEREKNISSLNLQIENRAKRQAAIDTLWGLRATGIKIRNEEITDALYADWYSRWVAWRASTLAEADKVSANLKNWLEYLDQMQPPPTRDMPYRNDDHKRFVHVQSEILLRLGSFLEREIK